MAIEQSTALTDTASVLLKALQVTKSALANKYTQDIYSQVTQKAPRVTGEFIDKIGKDIILGNEVSIGRVVSRAIYSQAVEFGRTSPKVPPHGKNSRLRRWVIIVLGTDDLRVVRNIALAIAKRGIPGKHIFFDVWKEFVKVLHTKLTRDIRECMRKYLNMLGYR